MITIEAEKVEQAYNKACTLMNRRVRLPGFRPGKIPQNKLEKIVGKEALKFEAFKILSPEIEKLLGGRRILSYTLEIGEPLQIEVE